MLRKDKLTREEKIKINIETIRRGEGWFFSIEKLGDKSKISNITSILKDK